MFNDESKKYMAKETAISAIDLLLNKKNEVLIHFFGGEPTLNIRTIKNVVDYVKLKNFNVLFHITTNGCINRETLDYLLDNKFSFTVSFDGLPVLQKTQRPAANGGDTNYLVEKTLDRIIESNGLLRIKVTITRSSVKKMVEITKFLSGKGIDFIHFSPIHCIGLAKDAPSVNPAVYAKEFIKARKYGKRRGIVVYDSVLNKFYEPKNYPCPLAYGKVIAVNVDGCISKCLEYLHLDNSLFNTGRIAGKKLILKSSGKVFDSCFSEKMKECKNCEIEQICSGFCPYRNLASTKSIFKVDKSRCLINKMIMREELKNMPPVQTE